MIRKWILILLCVLTFEVHSVQYISIDSNAVIPVNISSRNHNRIGISGDRIKKAFFKSNNIGVEVEEDTGQIFVQSVRPNCPETTVSIVTAGGIVQELELHFCDGPSEIVILQPSLQNNFLESDCNISEETVCSALEDSSLSYLVESFIKGNIPEGYVSIEDQDNAIHLCKGLKLQRVSRLVNDEQIIFVYRLQNVCCKTLCVTECQVNVLDGDWVFLDRYKLKPKECALVLIGCLR